MWRAGAGRVQLSKSDKNVGAGGWRVDNLSEAADSGDVLAHPCVTRIHYRPNVFENVSMLTKAGLIWYSTNNNVVKYYYNLIELFYFFEYIKNVKAEFSASLLQSSVSHDPSEIILICWFVAQLLSIIIDAKLLINNVSCYYWCWKHFCGLIVLWKPQYIYIFLLIEKYE